MSCSLRRRSPDGLERLKPILDEICRQVEQPEFITNDPVSFMHAFDDQRDQEIAGFLASLMAWGRRDVVLRKTEELIGRMGFAPYEYLMTYTPSKRKDFQEFRHRTFNHLDIHGLLSALQAVFHRFDSFELFWKECYELSLVQKRPLLALFRERFYSCSNQLHERTKRHISSPELGSTCKRLTMYLRWCLRKNSPVDPGIWDFLNPSDLIVPFDVHVAREGRKLGLLTRKSNDWKAVRELNRSLQQMDPIDPSRYDFALFGIGALGYDIPPHFLLNRLDS